jgi:hypothetical protein
MWSASDGMGAKQLALKVLGVMIVDKDKPIIEMKR